MLILFVSHSFLMSETADKIDTAEAFREAKMDHQLGLSWVRSFEMRENSKTCSLNALYLTLQEYTAMPGPKA